MGRLLPRLLYNGEAIQCWEPHIFIWVMQFFVAHILVRDLVPPPQDLLHKLHVPNSTESCEKVKAIQVVIKEL